MPNKTKQSGLTAAGETLLVQNLALPLTRPAERSEVIISKRKLKRVELIELVREAREQGKQDVGFSSRPFVLCGLPLKRPKAGTLIHIRKNGKFFLRVAGDPQFGLPFGQDRLLPIWVSTVAIKQGHPEIRFRSAAEILDALGLPKDGKSYRRLVEGFQRIFTSTIYFGTEEQLKAAAVWDWQRFHYFKRLRVWFAKDIEQPTLPADGFDNLIVLSPEFWEELKAHPIPVEMDVVRSLSDSPGCLDFYMWVCWRQWAADGEAVRVPLFGPGGLIQQLGVDGYGTRRKFRQTLKRWLAATKEHWPECAAGISEDSNALLLPAVPRSTGAIRPPR